MNHLRRVPQCNRKLRRLLLLIPLGFLGAMLFVYFRAPRPTATGDKWLWEQGETALALDADLAALPPYESKLLRMPITKLESLRLTDREGIRSLLRAFEGATLRKMTQEDMKANDPIFAYLDLALVGNKGVSIEVFVRDGRYILSCSNGTIAVAQPQSGQRFLEAYRNAMIKAQHQEPGYFLHGQTLATPDQSPQPSTATTKPTQRPRSKPLKAAPLTRSPAR